MLKRCGIYCIKNLIIDEIYIGSSIDVIRRHKEHFSDLRKNTHFNSKLQRAWNKYGEENFIFEVLECILISNQVFVFQREQEYINKLRPFYNSEKIVSILSTEEYEFPVLQIHPVNLEIIAKFSSLLEAREAFDYNLYLLHKAVKNKSMKTLYNYLWLYEKDYNKEHLLSEKVVIKYRNRKICQFNDLGKHIKTWENATEIGKEMQISISDIIQACHEKKRLKAKIGGFYWSYLNLDNTIPSFNIPIKKPHSNSKVVYQYNIDGEFIRQFNSVCEAAKEVESVPQPIIRLCTQNKLHLSVKGFRWSYQKFEQLEKLNEKYLCRYTTTNVLNAIK